MDTQVPPRFESALLGTRRDGMYGGDGGCELRVRSYKHKVSLRFYFIPLDAIDSKSGGTTVVSVCPRAASRRLLVA